MSHRRNLDKLIEETRSTQRNIVFPDTVRNARAADVFLLRGSSNPTLVQKIAAWMFGLSFIGLGLNFLAEAVHERRQYGFSVDVVMMLCASLLLVLLGLRIFRNGFPTRSRTDPEKPN